MRPKPAYKYVFLLVQIVVKDQSTRVVSEVSFLFLEGENEACDRGQYVEKFSVRLFKNTDKVSRRSVQYSARISTITMAQLIACMSNVEVRSVIQYPYIKNSMWSPSDIYRDICEVYDDRIVSVQTARKWISEKHEIILRKF